MYCLLSFTFACFLEGNIEQIVLKNYQESKERSEHVFDHFLCKEARFELKLGFVIVTNETQAKFVLLYKAVLRNPA